MRTGKGETSASSIERVKKLGIEGRSIMDKKELARSNARKP